jgi:hypothetical protein
VEATAAAVRTLAEKEGVGTAFQEVGCRSCRRFMMEVAISGKSVQRIVCKCGAENFLVIEADRLTVVSTPKK